MRQAKLATQRNGREAASWRNGDEGLDEGAEDRAGFCVREVRRRGAGRAARSFDVSDGVGARLLPTNV